MAVGFVSGGGCCNNLENYPKLRFKEKSYSNASEKSLNFNSMVK